MSKLEERESVVLTNEGEKIFGILHLPQGVKKPPVVLVCHGLGGHKTGRYRIYVDLAESLVQAGIAVFRFDFRGSGDSEGKFADMTLTGEVSDAIKALEFLHVDERVNNNRIGIFGRSMGGAVAVISAAAFGHTKSMVLWAPMYNGDQWRHKWEHVSSGIASEQEASEMRTINGQVAGMPFYAEMFSMRIDHELKSLQHVPLLIIHGEKDPIIDIDHSEMYKAERKKAHTKTELVRIPNADHDFTNFPDRALAIGRTVAWFEETL